MKSLSKHKSSNWKALEHFVGSLTHDIAAFDFDLAGFAYFVFKTDDQFALYQFPIPVITSGCSFSARPA